MIRIAILGFGTIGSGVYEIIEGSREMLFEKLGEEIEVKTILDRRMFSDAQIAKKLVRTIEEIEEDQEIALVVETMGGTEPAYDYVRRSLLAGKHVVSSNKALVAAHGTELLELAEERGVCFLFEASVGGGIPLLRSIAESMAGERIHSVFGILNGTTNYILTQMDEEGENFEEALGRAQELGYAEKEPEADIEGYDTCRKIAILAAIVTGREVRFEEIYTEGITGIEKTDFEYAQKMGASIKLFGSMQYEDGKLYAYVCPKMIAAGELFYGVKGVYNAVMIESERLGRTMLYGSGAGKLPTAGAVVADIISACRQGRNRFFASWSSEPLEVEEMEKTTHRYFIRFAGTKEGDIDHCVRAFGKSEAIYLEGRDEFAILTGFMREKDLKAVLSNIPGLIKFIRADL